MEARLELIWLPRIAPAPAEPRLRVLPPDPPAQEQGRESPVEFILSVCSGPQCGCSSIRLRAAPEAEGPVPKACGLPTETWLDLETKSLIPQSDSKGNPAFERLDGIIGTQLSDADRQELRKWFFDEKLALIHTTPPDEVDIEVLPDARSGVMIGFIEVFPCGLAFNFTLEDESWAVDDQYCVQPGCSCSETILSFLKLMGRSGIPIKKISRPPSIRYDYHTHKTKPVSHWAAAGLAPSTLLGALKAENPKLDTLLEYRHSMLQALYVRQALERAESRLRSLSAIRLLKTGRNDPCPCGSGRKFKHCCLNK